MDASQPPGKKLVLLSVFFACFFNSCIKQRLAFGFYCLGLPKASPYKFIQKVNKSESINIDMILEFLISNIEKKLLKQIKFVFLSAFLDIKFYAGSKPSCRKKLQMIVRRLSREQNQVFASFHKLKKHAINIKLNNIMIDSGKQRASITRITFILLKPLIAVFSIFKNHQKQIVLLPVKLEFSLFSCLVILTDALNSVQRLCFRRTRFVAKLRQISTSKKMKAHAYKAVKNLNRLALKHLRTALHGWNRGRFEGFADISLETVNIEELKIQLSHDFN